MSQTSSATTRAGNPSGDFKISRPNFTVHFRQPADMAGRYGFDYPRDADRYPMKKVSEMIKGKPTSNYKRLYKGNIANFNNIYLKDAKLSYSLRDRDYLPAWLVIFPHTTSRVYQGGSDMHSAGVKLDIEIQQIIGATTPLTADKFKKIVFVSSNPSKLTVSPTEIPLADLLKKGPSATVVDRVNGKKRNDYITKRAVHVKGVKNQLLTTHESIAVYAISSSNQKYLVGELMVHKNNVTYKAELVFVDVLTSPTSIIKGSNDIEYHLKYLSFNQALIRAEKRVQSKFKLYELTRYSKVSQFLATVKAGVPGIQKKYGLNIKDAQNKMISIIKNQLIELYELYGDHTPKDINGNIVSLNTVKNLRTFIFNTDFSAGSINGFAYAEITGTKIKWGNSVIIFSQANSKNDTLSHELGHSFTLRHVFDSKAPHIFYQGFSDKVMDYTWQDVSGLPNPNKRMSFTRYEWYQMQKDPSVHKL